MRLWIWFLFWWPTLRPWRFPWIISELVQHRWSSSILCRLLSRLSSCAGWREIHAENWSYRPLRQSISVLWLPWSLSFWFWLPYSPSWCKDKPASRTPLSSWCSMVWIPMMTSFHRYVRIMCESPERWRKTISTTFRIRVPSGWLITTMLKISSSSTRMESLLIPITLL